MKTTVILIGILFLISSCNCMKIKNDVRRVWSVKFQQCRCQTYSFRDIKSLDKLVPCEQYAPFVEWNDGKLIDSCNFDKRFKKKNRKLCKKLKKNEKNCKKNSYIASYPERCNVLPNEEYCDDLVGFSATSWGKNLTPRGKESKRCYEDTCR